MSQEVVLAVEATGNARFFRNYMENEGFDVKVINTAKFKVIVQSANKIDNRDAYVIASFLDRDFIPESHRCRQYDEDLRRLLKTRSQLVNTVVSIKNNIHCMMLSYGIVTRLSQFQSQKGWQLLRNELETHKEFNVEATDLLDRIQKDLEQTSASIKEVEKAPVNYVADDKEVELLRNILGVCKIMSATIIVWTSEINRFETYKEYASYCGLVPYVRESNENKHTGHFMKRGR